MTSKTVKPIPKTIIEITSYGTIELSVAWRVKKWVNKIKNGGQKSINVKPLGQIFRVSRRNPKMMIETSAKKIICPNQVVNNSFIVNSYYDKSKQVALLKVDLHVSFL